MSQQCLPLCRLSPNWVTKFNLWFVLKLENNRNYLSTYVHVRKIHAVVLLPPQNKYCHNCNLKHLILGKYTYKIENNRQIERMACSLKRRACLWARATPNAATPADELLTCKKNYHKNKINSTSKWHFWFNTANNYVQISFTTSIIKHSSDEMSYYSLLMI